MLKRGIGLGLLCITGHTYSANITVTTTEDVVKADSQCSLREAVEYVNQGMPEAGYNGCGGKDASAVIELQGKSEYKLASQLKIFKNVQIKSVYETNPTDNFLGRNNAVITVSGADRIFYIDRYLAPPVKPSTGNTTTNDAQITVNLVELTLKGCGQASCVDQGGLIYNKDKLTIEYGQLLQGTARQGGAIYNSGKYEKNKVLSNVSISNTIMKGNKAVQGGVIYADIPQFSILNAVIRDNEVTGTDATLFDSAEAFDKDATTLLGALSGRGILSSTIFNNKGYIVRVRDTMLINNITMIMNNMGLIFDAPNKAAHIANSILVRNGTEDCRIVSGNDPKLISNNLYSVGCGGDLAQQLSASTKLLAGSNTEGSCDVNSDGLLCPFDEYEDVLLGYFRPRLLASYKTISDSPIVNHGPMQNSGYIACYGEDQRGKARSGNTELCDLGAIELTVDHTATSGIGEDLLYGEIAKMSIADQLQDGELITPAQCKALLGSDVDANGKPWTPGCMKVVQTNTPSKGTLTLSQSGDVVYVPNGNWHGSDEFKIMVITTTTRFNDSKNPYIEVPGRIVQSPPNTFEDKSVKTSGGSSGVLTLLGLVGLLGLRRFRK